MGMHYRNGAAVRFSSALVAGALVFSSVSAAHADPYAKEDPSTIEIEAITAASEADTSGEESSPTSEAAEPAATEALPDSEAQPDENDLPAESEPSTSVTDEFGTQELEMPDTPELMHPETSPDNGSDHSVDITVAETGPVTATPDNTVPANPETPSLSGTNLTGAASIESIGKSDLPKLSSANSSTGIIPTSLAYVPVLLGEWVDPPTYLESGKGEVGARWYFDINDDGPAPGDEPIANNVFTVTLENSRFTKMPDDCLLASPDVADNEVTPLSTISEDGTQLICNLGTRNEGTAELELTGIIADGMAGSLVKATAKFGDYLEYTLSDIPIVAFFAMDAKFDEGTVYSETETDITYEDIYFPFSIRHATGSVPGPDSVTLNLTITNQGSGNYVELLADVCLPIDTVQPGYPYSAAGYPDAATTNLPNCQLTKTGNTTFQLVLTGLDYSSPMPTDDSNGQPLLLGMDVIAAGIIPLRLSTVYLNNYMTSMVTLTATEPEWVPNEPDAVAVNGDSSNNSNDIVIVRGTWTHQWMLRNQHPPYPGTEWTDTYRAPAGAEVWSGAADTPPAGVLNYDVWICQILDTNYVELLDALYIFQDGEELYFDDAESPEYPVWYYTGEWVKPDGVTPVDSPNSFACGGTVQFGGDPAAGNPAGWSTTPPDDLSTVKAVKIKIDRDMWQLSEMIYHTVFLIVKQRLKDDVPVGQDVWTWASILDNGNRDWTATAANQCRGSASSYVKGLIASKGYRFDAACPGRDVLQVVGSQPVVGIDVLQKEYGAGNVADYRVTYGLETTMPTPAPDQVVVTVDLPAGLTYVAQSAATEPVVVESSTGQTLTWTFSDVLPNAALGVLNFKAQIPDAVVPGSVFTATVTAVSQTIVRTDYAEFLTPDGGYTSLAMAPATPVVLLDDSGAANTSFTVTMRSQDSEISNQTDTIIILPYNQDGRGTVTSGTIALTCPVAAPDAATIYYSTADPALISEDPAADSNELPGDPSDLDSIWQSECAPNASAVRVTYGPLEFGAEVVFDIGIALAGAEPGDTFVAGGSARADRTQLPMRTSASFMVAISSGMVNPDVEHKEASHKLEKVANPPHGSTVNPGATINYTVTYTNTGADLELDTVILDDLSNVLNHAALEGVQSATLVNSAGELLATTDDVLHDDGSITAVADLPLQIGRPVIDLDGQSLTWAGIVEPGNVVTLTYAVRIKSGEWNARLNNSVFATGTPVVRVDEYQPGEVVDEPPAVAAATSLAITGGLFDSAAAVAKAQADDQTQTEAAEGALPTAAATPQIGELNSAGTHYVVGATMVTPTIQTVHFTPSKLPNEPSKPSEPTSPPADGSTKLQVAVSPYSENLDGTVTWTITAKNAGPAAASPVTVQLYVDSLISDAWTVGKPTKGNTSAVTTTGAQNAGARLTWTVGAMQPDEVQTLLLTIPQSDVTWDGDICVTAVIYSPRNPYLGNPLDRTVGQPNNSDVNLDTDQWDYNGWYAKAAAPIAGKRPTVPVINQPTPFRTGSQSLATSAAAPTRSSALTRTGAPMLLPVALALIGLATGALGGSMGKRRPVR